LVDIKNFKTIDDFASFMNSLWRKKNLS
jgi:hypothetical protein